MMAKMTTEERHLYTRYFYNSVIEFIYFLILYLETYGSASVSTINKHVKFFKSEVNDLISSFRGKRSTDKLIQMLKILDCFSTCEKVIRLNENINWKGVIFEDLVISKCVDMLLRRQSNLDDICKNLNSNCITKINKQNLLHIIKKYSYISVCSNQTLTLHHFHGLIGFEDHIFKSVIGYFSDILHHSSVLSYEEVKNHKFSPHCGLTNIVEILSILYCSQDFTCQDSCVFLNKKSNNYLKKRPIKIEKMETRVLPRSMYIGQIVHGTCGSMLHQWTGEIGVLKKNYGIIYCVIDFVNGSQGIFSIYFSKSSLKVISELNDLTKHLNVRDAVEFDAKFYNCKELDRCWKATRVKLCCNKFQYDEAIKEMLKHDTELERIKCSSNKCCPKVNLKTNISAANSQNIKNRKCETKDFLQKRFKSSDYESWSSGDSNNGLEIDRIKSSNGFHTELLTDNCFDISNEHVLDYLFVFGHIYLLMEDKGMAIAVSENKVYNILFMKKSVYASNVSEHFLLKDQKVLAAIPYLENENSDSVCVSVLVYGLNTEESLEAENLSITPKEFAFRTLFNNLKNQYTRCHKYNNSIDTLSLELLWLDLRHKIQLTEAYDSIKTQYKLPFAANKILHLLHSMWKHSSNCENFKYKVMQCFIKLFKSLPRRHLNQRNARKKNKREIKMLDGDFGRKKKKIQEIFFQQTVQTFSKRYRSESDVSNLSLFNQAFEKNASCLENSASDLCLTGKPNSKLLAKVFGKSFSKESNTPDLCLTVKPTSLNDSVSSCSSFKTCSTDFSEVFYSCESELNSPSKISVFDNDRLNTPSSSSSPAKVTVPEIEIIKPLPTIFNDHCKILMVNFRKYLKTKLEKKCRNIFSLRHNKYLSFQSCPSHKHFFKRKNRSVSSSPLKMTSKNCVKNSLTVKARVCLISNAFIFFATNIDGHDVVLPFPKGNMPLSLLEIINVNSSCEITVIPSAILNLSHILRSRVLI